MVIGVVLVIDGEKQLKLARKPFTPTPRLRRACRLARPELDVIPELVEVVEGASRSTRPWRGRSYLEHSAFSLADGRVRYPYRTAT